MIITPHLLISDDDRDFRETLQSLFRHRGYRTSLAADGEEAVRIACQKDVHLLLMDVHMPRMTGLEAVRQVRARRAEMPCILISAAVDESVLVQAKEAAVFKVLRKPINLEEVRRSVQTALRTSYGWDPSN